MSASNTPSSQTVRDILMAQFEIAWSLTSYHLESLTTKECLWRPAARCLHINEDDTGQWRADWPEHEGYDIGPPSIGWTTWHICFWWKKALDHIRGLTSLTQEDVLWPGSADEVRAEVNELRNRWLALLTDCSDSDLQVPNPASWPIPESSLGTIAAWLNIELVKNAAEIGLVRFLYAAQTK